MSLNKGQTNMDMLDPLGGSSILRKRPVTREIFDPNNRLHRESLQHFLKKSCWKGPQFYVEYPCSTVPETVLRKMALRGLELLDEN